MFNEFRRLGKKCHYMHRYDHAGMLSKWEDRMTHIGFGLIKFKQLTIFRK